MYRPGVWSCIYYPETDSIVPPEAISPYQHRDYSGDFNTKPQWSTPVEDADGYIEWETSGNAMSWTPEEGTQ